MKVENTQDDVRAAFAAASEEPNESETASATDAANAAGDVAVRSESSASESARADSPVAADDAGKNDDRVRGPDGKFTKKPEGADAKADATKAPVAPTATQTPAPVAATQAAVKAPQSWRADVREKFAALPPDVQAEVMRRENEVAQTLQSVAPAKRLQQAIEPHAAMFKESGVEPAQAIGSILQTVQNLARGSVGDRAAILAGMIKSYGVDVETLAKALDAPGAPQQQQQRQIDPSSIAQQVREQLMGELQAKRDEAVIRKFEATQPEFLDDVRETMAAIVEAAGRQGKAVELQDAYDQACWATPHVRAALNQREAAKAAQASQAAVAKSKNAASSVRPSPAVAPKGDGASNSTADDIRAAIAAHSGR